MYKDFFDGDTTMEAMINEGVGTKTQVDTQTTQVDIKEEPLFDDELARQAK
jgi:hypothetical protein